MTKIHFKRTVVRIMEPLLISLGYHLDTTQKVSEFVVFEKSSLEEKEVKFFIGFQLGQHFIPPQRKFTVELQKSKGSFFKPAQGYDKTMRVRLGVLIWAYYKQQIYSLPSHWWEFQDDVELEIQLQDAIDKLKQFGIPWLEDPNAVPPWEFI